MPTHLVWFRRDLRLQDNLALAAACRDASARGWKYKAPA
ncbi:deoxyribodipyrimidine photo-lyase, partial [Salmonella enterica]|nr:deoxyribodipyrimidine photo-lyase [Salmonella enterica]